MGRHASADRSPDAERACLLTQARFAIEAGIDMVQVREPGLDARLLHEWVVAIVKLADGSATRVLVNDRVDVALAAGAHGIHLRSDSVPPAAVRRLAPRHFVIGRSVHGPEEAVALADEADYLTAGTVWATLSKPASRMLLGPEGLAEVAKAARVPVLAIGGVTLARIDQVAQAGAAGAAAIGLFISDAAAADTEKRCGAVPLHSLVNNVRAGFHVRAPRREP